MDEKVYCINCRHYIRDGKCRVFYNEKKKVIVEESWEQEGYTYYPVKSKRYSCAKKNKNNNCTDYDYENYGCVN